MFELWDGLTALQRVFACMAIPATLVLAVQTVLLMFGIGDGEGADADIDPDGLDVAEAASGDNGLTLFTVRGIVAMFCVGGWAGIAFSAIGLPAPISIALAFVFGIGALVGIAFLMKAVLKLQSSGNIQIGSAVGKVGEVYIPIPAKGEGKGKINITVQDRFIEVDAISCGDTGFKTGDTVRVVSCSEAGLVVVEKVVG